MARSRKLRTSRKSKQTNAKSNCERRLFYELLEDRRSLALVCCLPIWLAWGVVLPTNSAEKGLISLRNATDVPISFNLRRTPTSAWEPRTIDPNAVDWFSRTLPAEFEISFFDSLSTAGRPSASTKQRYRLSHNVIDSTMSPRTTDGRLYTFRRHGDTLRLAQDTYSVSTLYNSTLAPFSFRYRTAVAGEWTKASIDPLSVHWIWQAQPASISIAYSQGDVAGNDSQTYILKSKYAPSHRRPLPEDGVQYIFSQVDGAVVLNETDKTDHLPSRIGGIWIANDTSRPVSFSIQQVENGAFDKKTIAPYQSLFFSRNEPVSFTVLYEASDSDMSFWPLEPSFVPFTKHSERSGRLYAFIEIGDGLEVKESRTGTIIFRNATHRPVRFDVQLYPAGEWHSAVLDVGKRGRWTAWPAHFQVRFRDGTGTGANQKTYALEAVSSPLHPQDLDKQEPGVRGKEYSFEERNGAVDLFRYSRQ